MPCVQLNGTKAGQASYGPVSSPTLETHGWRPSPSLEGGCVGDKHSYGTVTATLQVLVMCQTLWEESKRSSPHSAFRLADEEVGWSKPNDPSQVVQLLTTGLEGWIIGLSNFVFNPGLYS